MLLNYLQYTYMPKSKFSDPVKLTLDLNNFRVTPQENEIQAIQALHDIRPDDFNGLIDSFLENGYLPEENILVLEKELPDGKKQIVAEGNRRVACIKLIRKSVYLDNFSFPEKLKTKISSAPQEIKDELKTVPCIHYSSTEEDACLKAVARIHGRKTPASRTQWTALAKMRHDRKNGQSKPALDMLEKYLLNGSNFKVLQQTLWAADYPITVLDAALPKIANRLDYDSTKDLVSRYPQISYQLELEDLLQKIGLKQIGFDIIREKKEFNEKKWLDHFFGDEEEAVNVIADNTQNKGVSEGSSQAKNTGIGTPTASEEAVIPQQKQNIKSAPSVDTQKALRQNLQSLTISGQDTSKISKIRKEMLNLSLSKYNIAFILLYRSFVELSADKYCDIHNISKNNSKGRKLELNKILLKIMDDKLNKDSSYKDRLSSSRREINKRDNLFSTNSINDVVHGPYFMITSKEICIGFNNMLPLLRLLYS